VGTLRGVRLALKLQLGSLMLLFALIDAVVLLRLLMTGLLGDQPEGLARNLYPFLVPVPLLLLGIPALADLVALERRAGCLDLALTAPAVELYFFQRAAAVAAVLVAQGWLVVTAMWLISDAGFALLTVLLQVVAITLFVAAVTAFWAVHLRAAGAVWLAALATVAPFYNWLFFIPIAPPLLSADGPLLPGAREGLSWAGSFLVLTASGALFLLYTRRRLRRPETLL
jgi:hypothetical protein